MLIKGKEESTIKGRKERGEGRRMERRKDEEGRMDKKKDRRIEGRKEEWMDGWMDGWEMKSVVTNLNINN